MPFHIIETIETTKVSIQSLKVVDEPCKNLHKIVDFPKLTTLILENMEIDIDILKEFHLNELVLDNCYLYQRELDELILQGINIYSFKVINCPNVEVVSGCRSDLILDVEDYNA